MEALTPSFILQLGLGGVLALLGFVLKEIYSKVKKIDGLDTQIRLIEKDVHSLAKLHVIKDEWSLMRKEISDLSSEMKLAKGSFDDVTILKRDLHTAFKIIDDLKKSV